MVKDGANEADIVAYLQDKNIPADEITLNNIAEQILVSLPEQGYLTISNALHTLKETISISQNIASEPDRVEYGDFRCRDIQAVRLGE